MPILGNLSSAGKKPTAPTIGTASDGGTGTTASVAFTPSTYIGKSTITYTALSNPGSLTGTGSGSPITVSGLTTGTAYTFTVKGDTPYGVASDYSAASNSVTPASPSSFESIATVKGNSTALSLTISSIPSTYKSLQLRIFGITISSGSDTAGFLYLNGDTNDSNYAYHSLSGNGTSASAAGATANPLPIKLYEGTTIGSGYIVDIIDYASTSKNKTLRAFGGIDANGAYSNIELKSGLWLSTSAINSITFTSQIYEPTANFSMALYGIKG